MSGPKIAARMAAGLFVVLLTAGANAEGTTPTYVGMTEQDVGVMDRARPAYDAKGLPLGGFRLFPTLDASATYDDNVFRTATAQSDWFFTVAPALRLKSQWGRHFFEVYTGLSNYNFSTYSDQNLTDWNVGSDGRLDISRAASVSANAFYGELHELWSAPNNTPGFQAAPNRYYQSHTDLSASYQPSRFALSAGFSYDKYNWTNTPAIGGGVINNNDRDTNEYQAYARASYDFSPGYSAFVKASYDERDFDQFLDRSGVHRSSHGYRMDGGLNLQLTHLVSGEIFVGYLQQSYAKNVAIPLKDVSGLDYGLQLDWYVSPALTAHLRGSRQVADVVIAGASSADNKAVTLSADYELLRNVILQGSAGYTQTAYAGTSRTDDYPSAGIAVKYLWNSYASLSAGYQYSERSTNNSGLNYTDNAVTISLNLHV